MTPEAKQAARAKWTSIVDHYLKSKDGLRATMSFRDESERAVFRGLLIVHIQASKEADTTEEDFLEDFSREMMLEWRRLQDAPPSKELVTYARQCAKMVRAYAIMHDLFSRRIDDREDEVILEEEQTPLCGRYRRSKGLVAPEVVSVKSPQKRRRRAKPKPPPQYAASRADALIQVLLHENNEDEMPKSE